MPIRAPALTRSAAVAQPRPRPQNGRGSSKGTARMEKPAPASPVPVAPPGFDTLPEELILRVFSFLPRRDLMNAAAVCKEWSELAWEPMLWKAVRIPARHPRADKALGHVAKSFSSHLQALDLENCKTLTRLGLQQLFAQCTRLKSINLTGCSGVEDTWLQWLPDLPCIELVDLSDCVKLTDMACRHLSMCPRLKLVVLSGCRDITDNGIRLVSKCDKLQIVGLTSCAKVTDGAVELLSRQCKDLRALALNSCPKISDKTAEYLSEGCPRLSSLYLNGCTNITARGCSSLKDLHLGGCMSITDAGLKELRRLLLLSNLNIRHCEAVTDAGITSIVESCRELRVIDLRYCRALTDDAITAMAGLPALHSLDLTGLFKVSDDSLLNLAKARRLQYLNVKLCCRVTTYGVHDLLDLSNGRVTIDY